MDRWSTLDGQARHASRAAALFAALFAGLAVGCPLERGLSCGDGWTDPDFEECDPQDPLSFINACREQGYEIDAKCDPVTCTLQASEQDCTFCGDGQATGDEECDQNDFNGATCMGGAEELRCKDDCTIDYGHCPAVCGDGVVSDFEECDWALSCADDDDCPGAYVCYEPFGQCVAAGENFAPNLSCSFYTSKVIGGPDKSYTSGTIERCTQECFFGRNNCGFCGDGELDDEYWDLVWPGGQPIQFGAEICDGDEADRDKLHEHCRPLCTDDAINGDVIIGCNFECNPGCTDFAEATDIANPEGMGCCLAAGSPCVPNADEVGSIPGVPDLPCCSWLDNPTWMAERNCVRDESQQFPIAWECPA